MRAPNPAPVLTQTLTLSQTRTPEGTAAPKSHTQAKPLCSTQCAHQTQHPRSHLRALPRPPRRACCRCAAARPAPSARHPPLERQRSVPCACMCACACVS